MVSFCVCVCVCVCMFKVGQSEVVSSSWIVTDEGGVPLGGVDARVSRPRQARERVQAVSVQVWVTQRRLRERAQKDVFLLSDIVIYQLHPSTQNKA